MIVDGIVSLSMIAIVVSFVIDELLVAYMIVIFSSCQLWYSIYLPKHKWLRYCHGVVPRDMISHPL